MLRLPGINQAQFAASLVTNRDLSLMDRHMRQMLQVGDRLFEMCDQAMQINEMLATGRVTKASVEALYGDIIGDNNRVIRVSMEGVSDMAADAWAALKNWFKEMIRKVQDFFLKYSVFLKRSKESLKKLVTYVKNGLSGSNENYWCVDVLGGYSMEAAKNIRIPEAFEDRLTLAADEQVLTKRTANSAKAYYKDWRRHIERMLDDKSSKSEIKKILSQLKGEIKTTKLPKLAYALKTHIEQLEKSLDVIEEVVDKKDRSGYDQLPKWIQNKLNQIPDVKDKLVKKDDRSDQDKNGSEKQNNQDKDKDDQNKRQGRNEQSDNGKGASGNANNPTDLVGRLRQLAHHNVLDKDLVDDFVKAYNDAHDLTSLRELQSQLKKVNTAIANSDKRGDKNSKDKDTIEDAYSDLGNLLNLCMHTQILLTGSDHGLLKSAVGEYRQLPDEQKKFIDRFEHARKTIDSYTDDEEDEQRNDQGNGSPHGNGQGQNGSGQDKNNNDEHKNGQGTNDNESFPKLNNFRDILGSLQQLKDAGMINEQKLNTFKTLYNSNDTRDLDALIKNIDNVVNVINLRLAKWDILPEDGQKLSMFATLLVHGKKFYKLMQNINNTDANNLRQYVEEYEKLNSYWRPFVDKYQSVKAKIDEYNRKNGKNNQGQPNNNGQGQPNNNNNNNGQGQPNSNGNNQGQSNNNGQGQPNNNDQGQSNNNGQGQSNGNGQDQANGNNGQSNNNGQGQSNGNNQDQSNGNGEQAGSSGNNGAAGNNPNPASGGSAGSGTSSGGASAGGSASTPPSTPPSTGKAKYTYKLSNLSEDQKDKFNDVKILSLDTLTNVFNTYATPAKEVSVLNAALAKDISGDELTLKLDNNVSDKLEKLLDTDQGDSGIKLMDLDTGQKAIQQLEAYVKFADQIIKFREACVKDYVRTYRTCEKFKGNMKRDMLNNVRAVLHQRLLIAYKVSSEFRKSVVNLHKFVLSVLRLNTERAA